MYNVFFVDMRYNIRFIPFIFLFLSCITGCDGDSFVKVIDVDQADFPPKLAVTATLDTDSGGRFTLIISEAHSLGYYKTLRSDIQTIVRNGTVRLFEDDVEIFSIPGPFDLSVTGYSGKNGYSASFANISAVAGRTYHLEIDIEGYDKATATAVMPDAPIISNVSVDVENPVTKENVMNIESLSYSFSSSYSGYDIYMPFGLNIKDNTSSPDFYSFQMEYYSKSKYPGDEYEYEDTRMINVATSNSALIQDNPDVESMDLTMDGENYDLYSFDLMMLTDATFANTDIRLDLYSPYYEYYNESYNNIDYPSTYLINKYTLIVRHHTQEAFKQYRSMAFQLAGLGFFSEPVFITSNMENAYGGFSVQNTVRVTLYETE
jgi:hypothetical protein